MRTCSSSLLLNVRGVNYYNPFDRPVILSNAGLHSDVSDFTIFSGIDVDDSTNVPVSTNCIRSLDYYKVIYLHVSFQSHLPALLLLFKVIYLQVSFPTFHFSRGINDGKTSRVDRFQNESIIFWTNSTCWRGLLVSLKSPCGTWDVDRPSSMSFGQTYDPSSGSFGMRPIGRWLTRFATSNRHVHNSKGVNICSPKAFFRATLQLFTGDANAHPFWFGDARCQMPDARCQMPVWWISTTLPFLLRIRAVFRCRL